MEQRRGGSHLCSPATQTVSINRQTLQTKQIKGDTRLTKFSATVTEKKEGYSSNAPHVGSLVFGGETRGTRHDGPLLLRETESSQTPFHTPLNAPQPSRHARSRHSPAPLRPRG